MYALRSRRLLYYGYTCLGQGTMGKGKTRQARRYIGGSERVISRPDRDKLAVGQGDKLVKRGSVWY